METPKDNSTSKVIKILEDWNVFEYDIWNNKDNLRSDCYLEKATGSFCDNKLERG